jgi:hypothetical protein
MTGMGCGDGHSNWLEYVMTWLFCNLKVTSSIALPTVNSLSWISVAHFKFLVEKLTWIPFLTFFLQNECSLGNQMYSRPFNYQPNTNQALKVFYHHRAF